MTADRLSFWADAVKLAQKRAKEEQAKEEPLAPPPIRR